MNKLVHRILQITYRLLIALWYAPGLNFRMLKARHQGKQTFVICISEAHLLHVDSFLKALAKRNIFDKVALFIVTDTNTMGSLKRKLIPAYRDVFVSSALSIRFLFFCDLMLTVWEGGAFPYIGCRVRLCTFHNQPVKGVTFGTFNYKQINAMFFYGPLMRDLYLKKRRENPHWPDIDWYEVGQPLSDRLFLQNLDKGAARQRLGLDPERVTVIYAPSYEYCSSIATHGNAIIDALLGMNVNLIVKPHPTFYAARRIEKDRDGPVVGEWRERIRQYNALPHCVFPMEAPLESADSFTAADILVTDYSSIAFDGILRDMGVIYWNCPLFFLEYLPAKLGLTAESVLSDLSCNAGRDSGIVVNDINELEKAVVVYRNHPAYLAQERAGIREQLLFNPGHASEVMVDKIEELLRIRKNVALRDEAIDNYK